MGTGVNILDSVLPDIKPISEAPSRGELEQRAEQRDVSIEVVLKEERAKRYKAFNEKTGLVYLVTNPASWESRNGVLFRPTPEVHGELRGPRAGKRRKTTLDDSIF